MCEQFSLKDGTNEYEMMLYYKELINVRKTYSVFRATNSAVMSTQLDGGRAAITLDNHKGERALIISNPTAEEMTYTLTGNWNMVINGTSAMNSDPIPCQGEITIPAYSAVVFVNDNCLNG